jgi:exopolyphosphatase/guanosine-5'-triphosphate,3'-diphosphate pyrophosphatase
VLDAAAQQRGIEALARFAERLRDFDQARCARWPPIPCAWQRMPPQFLEKVKRALGFPIEVIAGREEARLIYLGVAHTLANPSTATGGRHRWRFHRIHHRPELRSDPTGIALYGLRQLQPAFFPRWQGRQALRSEAELAARRELQAIVHAYRETGWDEAIGSSGTAKAIVDLLELNGFRITV